ncbi:hypothetical protein ASE23_25805 [Rhizobium sp. Root73]|uniref:glycosyltransferase family 4 protein n=1 Tax=unclassified Rhizobium TaxID=2613769 RepID=UPI00072AFE78|nr:MULTISPECIES: glycosyltransferase family 4 protein [unclassified Rhizobium]KQY14919.1 hypothetical protein ASD36_25270 [Rhizobium sp. Root1334]KRC06358.1 hypothetical protein ASE23_25805 [Rhizobium sp. Root73]
METKPIVVAFPFAGGDFGGSDISAVHLILALDRTKVQPIIMLHSDKGDFSKYLNGKNVSYVRIDDADVLRPRHGNSVQRMAIAAAKYPWTMLKLLRFLRQHKIDIVHTNNGLVHTTWALPTVLSGAKLLWHHRGDPTAKGVNMLAPLLASHVVTVSKFAQPSAPLISLKNRMSVIHSPFDHPTALPDRDECRLAVARELGLREDTRFVGYFGALIDRKRPVRFVEAVHAFHMQNPDFPIAGLLFGPPEQYGIRLDGEVMAAAEKLGIADRIHLMGFRLPVAPYMCSVDILLVPAVNEPFGRTLIEAMLLGTPVIATDHGGNPEAIDHGRTGFLVPPENPPAFVEPMNILLKNPAEWRRISETARSSALAGYSVGRHVESVMEIYERLTGKTTSI